MVKIGKIHNTYKQMNLLLNDMKFDAKLIKFCQNFKHVLNLIGDGPF